MNILLTGGAGYIGSHAAVVFSSAGHDVFIFDNFLNSSIVVIDKLENLIGRRLPLVEGDVSDVKLLSTTLKDNAIDAVIHLAGLKSVAESFENPIDYYTNNVVGTISLIKAMSLAEVKTLIFSSSATVYGEPDYLPYDEKHPLRPSSPYGRCKKHVEELLRDTATSDPDWKIVCLRYFNPVGAHESGLIGEEPTDIPNNLMPYLARVATGALETLNIFGGDYPTRDGTGVRDYIHVMDLVEGHLAALDNLQNRPGCEAINIGTGRGVSVLEMVHAFEAVSGRSIPYRIRSRRAGDLAEFYASSDAALAKFAWKATRSLEDMCASTWNFQSNLTKGII